MSEQLVKYFLYFQANSVEVYLLPLSQTHHLVLDLSISLILEPELAPWGCAQEWPWGAAGSLTCAGVQKVLESANLPFILPGTAEQNSCQGGSKAEPCGCPLQDC